MVNADPFQGSQIAHTHQLVNHALDERLTDVQLLRHLFETERASRANDSEKPVQHVLLSSQQTGYLIGQHSPRQRDQKQEHNAENRPAP
jgi:hypothetical protein